ncbi:MAG: YhcH/YjgK/YiaL family protein [Atopobiaceae bacterium]|nr:YhcH/YjgK/YiaL family protein [Atopobiaceae bacterium]
MIAAKLEDAQLNAAGAERLARALEWISQTDMAALEPGRHDIEGDEIFANVMEVTTALPAEKSFEAHCSYLDVHYVISGEELIGVAPVGECPELQAYASADDFGLYGDPEDPSRITWVLLREGELCVTPPADAHKPACTTDEPKKLKKACVKVLVD